MFFTVIKQWQGISSFEIQALFLFSRFVFERNPICNLHRASFRYCGFYGWRRQWLQSAIWRKIYKRQQNWILLHACLSLDSNETKPKSSLLGFSAFSTPFCFFLDYTQSCEPFLTFNPCKKCLLFHFIYIWIWDDNKKIVQFHCNLNLRLMLTISYSLSE